MDQNDQNRMPEGFDSSRVSSLLNSAQLAEQDGNSRLAIHLYCAAFEAAQDDEGGVDERILSGLRQAWTLACQQGDRSTAEAIFNDLAPYNSDEQTQAALAELQHMAMGQLEEMGFNKGEMEDMALALADEMRDNGLDLNTLAQRFPALPPGARAPHGKVDLSQVASSLASEALQNKWAPYDMRSAASATPASAEGEPHAQELGHELRYARLTGFERAKASMSRYGIVDAVDTKLRGFLEQAESFHGISGPVLSHNFLIFGPSREDSGVFAQATANEIGWPVITMIVEVNEHGDGTIKVMAPFRRPLFGPPRLTDLPNPCILVIQNVDLLQQLFWREEQAFKKGHEAYGFKNGEDSFQRPGSGRPHGTHGGGGMPAWPQRSLQGEILGYLGALFARGGIFVIATSAGSEQSPEQEFVLCEQLESFFGKLARIPVEMPTREERLCVLTAFSGEHPSFHDLDLPCLARLSEGMGRYEIVLCCQLSVEQAYSESLKQQRHQMVSMEEVLTQFVSYLTPASPVYEQVEDYLVAQFAKTLEADFLQTNKTDI